MPELAGGLLFDLDGTLIDTAPDMGEALNRLLRQAGKATLSADCIRPHVSGGSRALVALGFGQALSPLREKALIEGFLACYAQCTAERSVLFKGMDALLQQLENRGVAWGIITNKPARFTVPLLQHLNLTARCSTLVCGDSMAQRKPHPAPIELACRYAKLAPSKSVYVGDAERDIAAGRAAGLATALMQWGYFGADEDVASWGADWQCADADALWQVCEKLGLVLDP